MKHGDFPVRKLLVNQQIILIKNPGDPCGKALCPPGDGKGLPAASRVQICPPKCDLHEMYIWSSPQNSSNS